VKKFVKSDLDAEGLSRDSVTDIMAEFSDMKKLPKSDIADAEHATDFEIPIYNVWKQQEKTPGSKHFGNKDMWMRCYSLDEIADTEGIGKTQIHEICSEFSDLKKLNKSDLADADRGIAIRFAHSATPWSFQILPLVWREIATAKLVLINPIGSGVSISEKKNLTSLRECIKLFAIGRRSMTDFAKHFKLKTRLEKTTGQDRPTKRRLPATSMAYVSPGGLLLFLRLGYEETKSDSGDI